MHPEEGVSLCAQCVVRLAQLVVVLDERKYLAACCLQIATQVRARLLLSRHLLLRNRNNVASLRALGQSGHKPLLRYLSR